MFEFLILRVYVFLSLLGIFDVQILDIPFHSSINRIMKFSKSRNSETCDSFEIICKFTYLRILQTLGSSNIFWICVDPGYQDIRSRISELFRISRSRSSKNETRSFGLLSGAHVEFRPLRRIEKHWWPSYVVARRRLRDAMHLPRSPRQRSRRSSSLLLSLSLSLVIQVFDLQIAISSQSHARPCKLHF